MHASHNNPTFATFQILNFKTKSQVQQTLSYDIQKLAI
jgi:hypothetical protein